MLHILSQLLAHLSSYLVLIEMGIAQHYHLSVHQFLIMNLLAIGGQNTFREIRGLLGIPKSSLTFYIDRLEKRGLVVRQRESKDRRQWSVLLTSRGIKLVEEMNRRESIALDPLLDTLSKGDSLNKPQELEQLLDSKLFLLTRKSSNVSAR